MEAFTGTVENPGSGAFMVQEPPFRPPIPSTGMGGKLMLTLVELYFIFQILFSSPMRVFPDGGGRVGVSSPIRVFPDGGGRVGVPTLTETQSHPPAYIDPRLSHPPICHFCWIPST